MAAPTELLEKMEHAGHAAHGHGDGHGHGGGGHGASTGKLIGITMAILGVMLAFCAAMVGDARTDLVATMVDQSNTWNKYQAQRLKHRLMLTQLATLHALSPSRSELGEFEKQLSGVRADTGKKDSDDAAEIKSAIELATKSLVSIITPDRDDLGELVAKSKQYEKELEAAQEWAESYDEAIEAHAQAGERYDWAQLSAEIGIVVASIALLLSSRKAWAASALFGAACAGLIAFTFVTTRGHIHHAEEEIARTKSAYQQLRKKDMAQAADERLVAGIEAELAELEGHP